MPILVKSDDVRSRRKAKVCYGRHRSQWVKVVLQPEGAQNRHLETVIN